MATLPDHCNTARLIQVNAPARRLVTSFADRRRINMADIESRQTPFDMIGGAVMVQTIVDRFYDLMAGQPTYAELRALHKADLTPMRASLTGFLIAWLGGPRTWFTENPGKCVMSLHSGIAVTPATARQWADAMRLAIADSAVEPDIGMGMADALEGMAMGMVRPQPAGG